MKIGAVIAEYNPFHNGHRYQINDLRSRAECDYVVALMSGNFVQRGECAVYDKWKRTEAALMSGVDMVLELPVYYALSGAQRFAMGAVSTLKATGIVDALGFGCETDSYLSLKAASDLLKDDAGILSNDIRAFQANGMSYPAALAAAAEKNTDNPDVLCLLNQPNAILALEYIRALEAEAFSPSVVITKRVGSGHDSDEKVRIDGTGYTSATTLRNMLFCGHDISQYAPVSFDCLPNRVESFSELTLYALRRMSYQSLCLLPDVDESLAHLLAANAPVCKNTTELMFAVKSKCYTMARIKRILLCALLSIKSTDVCSAAQYVRVLGVASAAREALLSALAGSSSLPVIVNGSDSARLDKTAAKLFALDVFASDTYTLVSGGQPRSDYTQKLICV